MVRNENLGRLNPDADVVHEFIAGFRPVLQHVAMALDVIGDIVFYVYIVGSVNDNASLFGMMDGTLTVVDRNRYCQIRWLVPFEPLSGLQQELLLLT